MCRFLIDYVWKTEYNFNDLYSSVDERIKFMVDYIKKYKAIDEKYIKDEKKKMDALIETGLYPSRFEMPLTLQFELTSKCNVFCKHCYNDSGNNVCSDRMTPQRWLDFSKNIVSLGGIFECILSGGEPLLLGDKLFEIMDVLHDDGTCFLLITNGYLLTKEKVTRLSKYRYRWLQVSIDGSESEYHDSFRQKEGSWKNAVNGAFMVSASGIPLTIAHCVTPYNLDKLDDMCDLAYQLGASTILVGEVNLSGRTQKNRDLLLDDTERALMFEKIEYNQNKYLGKMTIQRSASTRNSVMRYLTGPNTGMIIRPNGDLRLDCMVPFVIGNVLDSDFNEIWKLKGQVCWNDIQVQKYINSFNEFDINDMMTNYVDSDIHI